MDRRGFLRLSGVTAGLFALGATPLLSGCRPGTGTYGFLAEAPNADGLLLPAGFTSRIVAVSGQPVAGIRRIVALSQQTLARRMGASALVYSQMPFTDVQSGAIRVDASTRIGTSSAAAARRDNANLEETTRPGMPFQ